MFITKKHLPRRTFLKAAGFLLALPLLESMVPAQTLLAQGQLLVLGRRAWVSFMCRTGRSWTSGFALRAEGSGWEFPRILEADGAVSRSRQRGVSGL